METVFGDCLRMPLKMRCPVCGTELSCGSPTEKVVPWHPGCEAATVSVWFAAAVAKIQQANGGREAFQMRAHP